MTPPLPPRPSALRGVAKRITFWASRWLGLNAVARALQSGRLPILCYHNIVRGPVPPWMELGGLHLPATTFARQMEFVSAHCHVLDLEQAWERLVSGEKLPNNAVALTFDDGYFGTLDIAAQVLQRLRLPATVFLATDYVETGGWFWWDQLPAMVSSALGRRIHLGEWGSFDLTTPVSVREALSRASAQLRAATIETRRRFFRAFAAVTGQQEGSVPSAFRPATWAEVVSAPDCIRYGGHGASHRVVDLLAPADLLDDARRCRAALDRRVGQRAGRAFCYPEGRTSACAPEALREAGFALAVTASGEPRLEERASRAHDPMRLPRLGVSAGVRFDAFIAALSGTRALLPLA